MKSTAAELSLFLITPRWDENPHSQQQHTHTHKNTRERNTVILNWNLQHIHATFVLQAKKEATFQHSCRSHVPLFVRKCGLVWNSHLLRFPATVNLAANLKVKLWSQSDIDLAERFIFVGNAATNDVTEELMSDKRDLFQVVGIKTIEGDGSYIWCCGWVKVTPSDTCKQPYLLLNICVVLNWSCPLGTTKVISIELILNVQLTRWTT